MTENLSDEARLTAIRCDCQWADDLTPEAPCGCGTHQARLYRDEVYHWKSQHWTSECLIAELASHARAVEGREIPDDWEEFIIAVFNEGWAAHASGEFTDLKEAQQESHAKLQLEHWKQIVAARPHEQEQAPTKQHDRLVAATELKLEIQRLLAMAEAFDDYTEVCACGCPLSEHENYGEDGYCCEHDDHQCMFTSKAVYAQLHTLRAALTAKDQQLAEAERLNHKWMIDYGMLAKSKAENDTALAEARQQLAALRQGEKTV